MYSFYSTKNTCIYLVNWHFEWNSTQYGPLTLKAEVGDNCSLSVSIGTTSSEQQKAQITYRWHMSEDWGALSAFNAVATCSQRLTSSTAVATTDLWASYWALTGHSQLFHVESLCISVVRLEFKPLSGRVFWRPDPLEPCW